MADIAEQEVEPVSRWTGLKNAWRACYDECVDQKPHLFLWFPVFVSFGIGAYYTLPQEPPVALGGFAWLCALAGLTISQYRVSSLLILLTATGFCAAQLRTYLIHTPILQKDTRPVVITGVIESIEDMGDGQGARLILSDLEVEKLEQNLTPRKIRLKIRNDQGLLIGQRIEALAKLHAPSPPVMPGAFDFQRYLYFQGIGGVGFIFKDAKILEDSVPSSFSRLIEEKRHSITTAIETHMSYPQASIAIALMVGRKTAITETDNEAMRTAGLAHMLAISGLHVGLFSGVVFFLVRLLMAFVPNMALRHPIKKYAAVIAMSAAIIYMLIAGATIPTQRAILMTGIVFLAIILDRSPISLRLVAFAALIVLLLFPESLLSASFHMSFAAVTCLILFYDWLRPYWSQWHRQAGFMRRGALYFAGVCFTTVIASLATAPFALFHFQQFAVYGLIGNLIAVPILAFIIMPAVVAAFLLMMAGLEWIAFFVIAQGISAVLEVAHFVAALPHALLKAPAWPQTALAALVLSGLIFTLWRGRFRVVAMVPFLLFLTIIIIYKQPDILISSDFKLSGFKAPDGHFYVSSLQKNRFARENWVQSYGLDDEDVRKWPKESAPGPITCDELACRIILKGYEVSYLKKPFVASGECLAADIVLSPEPLRSCNAALVDLFDARYRGAHGIWLGNDGIKIKATEELRGLRPWGGLNEKFSDKSALN